MIGSAVGRQLHLLATLLENNAGCPPVVAFLSKGRKAGFLAAVRRGARDVATLGSKHFKVMFLCSLCYRTCCGPNGRGYTAVVPSALLRALAPVVALGLKLLLVAAALAAKSLGVEVKLPGGMSQSDAAAQQEAVADLLEFGVEFALDEFVGSLASSGEAGGGGAAVVAGPAGGGGGVKLVTGNAYAELKALLESLDPVNHFGLHQFLGLELLVGGKGTSAVTKQWVCGKCKPGFVKAGADFKPTAGH